LELFAPVWESVLLRPCFTRRRVEKEPDAICCGSEPGNSIALAILGKILAAMWKIT
jgi:hypothetical protein